MKNSKNMYFVLCGVILIFAVVYGGYRSLLNKVELNRKIYVYNMDEVLIQTGFVDSKKKFDEDVLKLNDEVMAAEKKIKNLKNEKVKNDFATVYLDSLKLKRNELIDNYQKQIEELTNKINKNLKIIAAEKNAPTIFNKSSIAVMTNDVIDVSAELVDKIKQ